MARFCKIYILLFLLTVFSSCQNEGNIGDLYGQWSLKESHVNNQVKTYSNIYFAFQGKVVWTKRVSYENHGYTDVFGNFEQKGDSLLMRFVQKSDYITPKQLIEETCAFPDATNVRVLISSISSSDLILSEGNNYWIFEKF